MHVRILNELHELQDVTWVNKVLYCKAFHKTNIASFLEMVEILHYLSAHIVNFFLFSYLIPGTCSMKK